MQRDTIITLGGREPSFGWTSCQMRSASVLAALQRYRRSPARDKLSAGAVDDIRPFQVLSR